jgi:hypothetical protein
MRILDFKYYLLNKNDDFKKELMCVEKCSVEYNSLTRLKSSASMSIGEGKDIDYFNDRIKIICRLNGKEYPLGIFLICSPSRTISTRVTRTLTLYSKLHILEDDKVLERYFVSKGINVVNECKRILGDYKVSITESDKVTGSNREWPIGTEKIEIINDLLSSINYTSLRVDGNGYYTADPYILPTDKEVDFIYEPGIDGIMMKDMEDEIDLFSVPNTVIRYTNNADINPPLRAVYENNNADSPTSIVNRGRRIVDVEEVADAADYATLMAACKKAAYELTDKYSHIEFQTAINPEHGYMNCIILKNHDINDKYIETSWSFDCAVGGKMKHTCRKVVNI